MSRQRLKKLILPGVRVKRNSNSFEKPCNDLAVHRDMLPTEFSLAGTFIPEGRPYLFSPISRGQYKQGNL